MAVPDSSSVTVSADRTVSTENSTACATVFLGSFNCYFLHIHIQPALNTHVHVLRSGAARASGPAGGDVQCHVDFCIHYQRYHNIFSYIDDTEGTVVTYVTPCTCTMRSMELPVGQNGI